MAERMCCKYSGLTETPLGNFSPDEREECSHTWLEPESKTGANMYQQTYFPHQKVWYEFNDLYLQFYHISNG